MSRPGRTVAILAVPRVTALDHGVAANILGGHRGYHLMVCGEPPRPVPAEGVVIVPSHGLGAIGEADVLVVPGFEVPHVALPDPYLEAIARIPAADPGGPAAAGDVGLVRGPDRGGDRDGRGRELPGHLPPRDRRAAQRLSAPAQNERRRPCVTAPAAGGPDISRAVSRHLAAGLWSRTPADDDRSVISARPTR